MAASTSTGFCYSEASSSGDQQPNNTQTFEPNSQLYNLHPSDMGMVGFQPKNNNPQNDSVLWNHNRLLLDHPDHLSLRSVFPSQRPIQGQGLSLTLNSSNPSLSLQSFDLRQSDEARFGPPSLRSVNYQSEHPQMMQEGFVLRNSKYLNPAKELLTEFFSLDINQSETKQKVQWDDSVDAITEQSLYALDLLELQRRRTKLLHMLEEVNRRYKQYCAQMKALVSRLEAVAGEGAGAVYTAMAARAMSRHFRCLKDGILRQIKATKKALGDKDTVVPGATKGETPRLRVLDQSLRQQKAYQQLTMMDSHPWRPQRGLPERSVGVLRAWLFEHFLHPYPSDVDKHILARQTGLSRSQVSNWFINARVRLWKPMVEEMYLEDLKDTDGGALDRVAANPDTRSNTSRPSQNDDQKPTQDQLIRIEPETLSSIVVNNSAKINGNQRFDEYGVVQSDFSSYGHNSSTGFGGVSLTLGLHQHGGGGGGLGLGYSPAADSALFYSRDDQMEDCQTVQYSNSLMESESQNLQYRNLMGAQLLHDLAG